jgi:hypothetical protein
MNYQFLIQLFGVYGKYIFLILNFLHQEVICVKYVRNLDLIKETGH